MKKIKNKSKYISFLQIVAFLLAFLLLPIVILFGLQLIGLDVEIGFKSWIGVFILINIFFAFRKK